MTKIREFLDEMHDDTWLEKPIEIRWSRKGTGFGSVTFFMYDGQVWCDNEGMDRGFIMQVLLSLAANARLMDERDPCEHEWTDYQNMVKPSPVVEGFKWCPFCGAIKDGE